MPEGLKFGPRHYVPVLKGKRAEFPALAAIHSKTNLTPLMEAVPSAPPEEIPRRMSGPGVWPSTSPYFIDLAFLDDPDDETTPAPATHPVIRCFAEVAKKQQLAVPVTSLSRSLGYQSAVHQITTGQKHGLALRLTADDFEDEGDLTQSLNNVQEYFGLPAAEIDLLLDAGSVAGGSAGAVAQTHRAHIALLPDIDEWRTLTVLAAAFPPSLAPLLRDQWNVVTRHDWRGWRSLVTGPKKPTRLPAYGDFAIAHPSLPPEGRATILAQIRYTTPESWLIWKGGNVFKHEDGFGQFCDICRSLIQRNEYSGQEFSQGDADIHQKATSDGSPGNAETWRRIGTNHHVEMVLDQLANLPAL